MEYCLCLEACLAFLNELLILCTSLHQAKRSVLLSSRVPSKPVLGSVVSSEFAAVNAMTRPPDDGARIRTPKGATLTPRNSCFELARLGSEEWMYFYAVSFSLKAGRGGITESDEDREKKGGRGNTSTDSLRRSNQEEKR
ncbi:hypothetical protein HPB51_013263 [Rhipicephalus microplus]|uniref:Uncharacterized protein n=1 Tax=Rhipicephalus microplus TaxID=6941 RepID=A0A9J6E9Y7_RHIMP|nr:hypothetical protein HPB51_013263 [Rhipicephalus microplus]